MANRALIQLTELPGTCSCSHMLYPARSLTTLTDEKLDEILESTVAAFADDGTSCHSTMRHPGCSSVSSDPAIRGLLGGDLRLAKALHEARIRAALLEGRVYAVELDGKIVTLSLWFRRPMKLFKTYACLLLPRVHGR